MNDSAEADFGLSQVGQVAIPVSDVERAITFYSDALGMRFLFQAPPGLGFFDCGGVRLMLDGPAAAQAGSGSVIYYKVPDLHEAHATLSARGSSSRPSPTSSQRCPIMSCGWPSSVIPTRTFSR